MARLEVQKPSVDGTTLRTNFDEAGVAHTPVADTADKYPNSGKEFLQITKGVGAAVMTLASQARDPYGDGAGGEDWWPSQPPRRRSTDRSTPGEHNERSGADKDYTSIAFDDVVGLEVTVIRA